jgi:hypothetical protein
MEYYHAEAFPPQLQHNGPEVEQQLNERTKSRQVEVEEIQTQVPK